MSLVEDALQCAWGQFLTLHLLLSTKSRTDPLCSLAAQKKVTSSRAAPGMGQDPGFSKINCKRPIPPP